MNCLVSLYSISKTVGEYELCGANELQPASPVPFVIDLQQLHSQEPTTYGF